MVAGWNNNKCLHDLWSSTDARSWSLRSNSTWGCRFGLGLVRTVAAILRLRERASTCTVFAD